MKRIFLTSALAFITCASHAAGPQPMSDTIQSIVAPYLSAKGEANKAPGVWVGTTLNGSHHSYGYGTTDITFNRVPSATDVYENGSITKTFTALVLALEANASGNAEKFLQTRLVSLIPELSSDLAGASAVQAAEKRTITLAELASHSGGLPYLYANMHDSSYKAAQLYGDTAIAKLIATPGAGEYHYSNPSFSLLGMAVSLVRGKPFEELVMSSVVRPLGLSDTGYSPAGHYVQGYNMSNGKLTAGIAQPFAVVNEGAGGLRSSGNDLLRYVDALMTPPPGALGDAIRLIKPVRAQYDCPHLQNKKCGVGLALESYDIASALPTFYKTGQSESGFASIIAFDGKAGVVLSFNERDVKDLVPMAREILDAIESAETPAVAPNRVTDNVSRAFYEVSGYVPSDVELAYWRNLRIRYDVLLAYLSQPQIIATMKGEQVDRAFHDVTGRGPTAADVAYWRTYTYLTIRNAFAAAGWHAPR